MQELSVQPVPTNMATSPVFGNQSPRGKPLPIETRELERAKEAEPAEKEAPSDTLTQIRNEHSEQEVDRGELETAIEQLNANVSLINERYSFHVDDDTDRLVVQVMDGETGEVIRQVPPESVLEIASQITGMVGIFLDELA